MLRPLEGESIERLQQIFEAARLDLTVLARLQAELEQRPTGLARLLRLKVIGARVAAEKAATRAVSSARITDGPISSGSLRPLQVLLREFDLDAPDARPLHTYKVSAKTREDLERLLFAAAKSGRLQKYNREDAALFVLWAADWFRRHYGGGIRKYEDLGRVLGVRFDGSEHWRALVDEGLAWWRRPVVRRASGSHRLLSLALEGGFPVRVLEERERGWLVRYLVGLVSALLALPGVTQEASRELAWTRRTELRETYQDEGFCALAADLALTVVRLRREAERASLEMPGLSPSAVLDAIRPGWRADLSIADEGEAARRLIDGMMRAPVQSTLGGEVGVTRQLLFREGSWCPAVRLGLSGQIATSVLS